MGQGKMEQAGHDLTSGRHTEDIIRGLSETRIRR
jgi:hypothetical protein